MKLVLFLKMFQLKLVAFICLFCCSKPFAQIFPRNPFQTDSLYAKLGVNVIKESNDLGSSLGINILLPKGINMEQ